jgi:hypothetical protein
MSIAKLPPGLPQIVQKRIKFMVGNGNAVKRFFLWSYLLAAQLPGRTVQRIPRGVESRLLTIGTAKLEAWQIFVLNFKGTPSQEEHKTIFSSLKIYVMALSDQIDFLAFYRLRKLTY